MNRIAAVWALGLGMPIAGCQERERASPDPRAVAPAVTNGLAVDLHRQLAAARAMPAPDCLPPTPVMVPFVPVFRADRPFLYLIRGRNSGAILFVGRVLDPRA